jgi:hypothetical protein
LKFLQCAFPEVRVEIVGDVFQAQKKGCFAFGPEPASSFADLLGLIGAGSRKDDHATLIEQVR